MITFLIVSGTILITSLLTSAFIVVGIQMILEKLNKKDDE